MLSGFFQGGRVVSPLEVIGEDDVSMSVQNVDFVVLHVRLQQLRERERGQNFEICPEALLSADALG